MKTGGGRIVEVAARVACDRSSRQLQRLNPCYFIRTSPCQTLERILDLITRRLTTWANAHDWRTFKRKHKAITTLLLYAAWQERYRQQPMIFDAFLYAANASQSFGFLWHYFQPFVNIFLSDASDTSLK